MLLKAVFGRVLEMGVTGTHPMMEYLYCVGRVVSMTESDPFVVACIPAYNEERSMGGVVVRAMEDVDRVVGYDDGSGDLTGASAGGLDCVRLFK